MIRLNRTTEYSLIALRYMNRKKRTQPLAVTSAREIADHYGLPFEITAKTLQRLKDTGLIQSAHGAQGGYTLKRGLDEVTLAEFLIYLEGPQSIVICAANQKVPVASAAQQGHVPHPDHKESDGAECDCQYHGKCEIRGFMRELNRKVARFLEGIHLSELGAGSFQKLLPLQNGLQSGSILNAPLGEEP